MEYPSQNQFIPEPDEVADALLLLSQRIRDGRDIIAPTVYTREIVAYRTTLVSITFEILNDAVDAQHS